MVVRPQVSCLAFDQLASTCSYTAPEIEVPLNGQWSESKDFTVSLNWTQDPNRPLDAETFLVGVETFDYKVKGASFERPPERTESFRYFSGYGYAPKLRCDRVERKLLFCQQGRVLSDPDQSVFGARGYDRNGVGSLCWLTLHGVISGTDGDHR